MVDIPELLLIVCEGRTEAEYFNILKRSFKLPTWIKVLPESGGPQTLGQHEHLIDVAATRRGAYAVELGIEPYCIEAWAVCDRDNYRQSFTQLRQYAESQDVNLAFSDPQFENYLLQHFSANNSSSRGQRVIQELSEKIGTELYRKSNLSWLEEMIDKKHDLVRFAAINAENFSTHTREPFFTVQKLVERVLSLEGA